MSRGEEERRLSKEIERALETIHPNPGPRDKTEEGRKRRNERRYKRRAEKRAAREAGNRTQDKKFWNIVTWNVQRLSVGTSNKRRLKSVAQYVARNRWDVVMLTEVKASGRGVVWLGEGENLTAVIYTQRAAIMLRGEALEKWCEEGQRTKHDERTISIKISNFTFISTYLPVWMGNNAAEIEQAKEILKNHKAWTNRDEVCIIGGDFNAHIGAGETRPGVCGSFGMRNSNHQGQSLLEWCEENDLAYVNSFYNHTRRGTWFNMALARWYELDGFLMKNCDRHKFVRKISTVGEATLSDHKPKKIKIELVKKFNFRRRKVIRIPKIRWERLKLEEVEIAYKNRVRELMEEYEETEIMPSTATSWGIIAEIVNKAAEEVCGVEEKPVENPWMEGRDEEIQTMRARINGELTRRNNLRERQVQATEADEREDITRELNECKDALKEARKDLKRKSKEWETEWWEDIIQSAKEASERNDSGSMYKKLRELGKRGQTKATNTTNITKEQFKEHFKRISKDRFENTPEEMEETVNRVEDISQTEKAREWREELDKEPEREEIEAQMRLMKNSAPGKDGVRLIYLMKGGPEMKHQLHQMIKFMFNNGSDRWEEALKIGLVIPLHKKGDKNVEGNYRGVCLLPMGSRILARIMANRLRIWAEKLELLDDEQAGFRSKRSTADITQMMIRIQEDTRDLVKRAEASGQPIPDGERPAARLLDLRKAYPRVNKPALWGVLQKYGIGEKCLRVLKDLHEATHYRIKSREGESEAWTNERGLREGCPTSPPLFNIFHQAVMRIAKVQRKRKADETGMEAGITFKWVPGSCFPNEKTWEKHNSEAKRVKIDSGLFADDTSIIGKKKELEQGVQETKKVMSMFEERNNEDKEEHLEFGTEEGNKIRMLGSYMGEEEDNRQRIKRAGMAWMRVKRQLKGAKISKKVQARVVEACVESTLLFDCQARTWQVRDIKRLQQTMDKKYRSVWSNKREPPLMQMQREGKNMFDVRRELGVKSVRQKIEKRVLERIGHVMRMEDTRIAKATTLGWLEDLEGFDKLPGKKRKTVLYWKKTLKEAALDWTRVGEMSQDRKEWKALVKERVRDIDEWERRSGKQVQEERGNRNSQRVEEESLTCDWPDCGKVCKSKSGLANHRKRMHLVSSQKVVFECQDCGENFKQEANMKNHKKFCTGLRAQDPEKKKCPGCLGEFSKSYFSKHYKKCRNTESAQTQESEPRVYKSETYICPGCGQERAKTNRSRHERICLNGEGVL